MTIADPWGPAEEPTPAPQPEAPAVATAYVDVKPRLQAVESDEKITLTFKGSGQFSDRWLVAHVANPAEGLALLNDPQFKELLDLSHRIGEYDANRSGASAKPAGSAAQPSQQRSRAPQGATEPPAWAPPKPYDDFVYVTKISKSNGRPWHAWMAPEKGDTREPLFFNPPK